MPSSANKGMLLSILLLASSGPMTAESPQPHREWTFRTNGPIVGSPVLWKDLLFVGSADSSLYAIHASTGRLQWKFQSFGPIKSSVSLERERLILNAGDGRIVALDPNTGTPIWEFRTGGERTYEPYGYADYYHSSPVVIDSTVFVGSGDNYLYALNIHDGTIRWKFKSGDVIHAPPVTSNGKVYVGSFDGNVYALEQLTGSMVWKFKSVGHRFFPKGEMQGAPVAGNGLIYVGSRDYNLYAIDAEKGYCHWNRQFPLGWAMALAVQDTVLFVGTSDDDLMLALDGRTGKEIWKQNVQFNTFGPCAFMDSTIVFGTLMGRIHALDKRDGSERWVLRTDGLDRFGSEYFDSGARVDKGRFYSKVGDPDGYILALKRLGALFGAPRIRDGLLFFGTYEGNIYCYDVSGGKRD